jgi:hypothetical protein
MGTSRRAKQPSLSEVAARLERPRNAAGEVVAIAQSVYPQVAATLEDLSVPMDRWQSGIQQLTLAQALDGSYLCRVDGVTLSTCRQVGKTYTFGWLFFALAITFPGLNMVWTAHHEDTTIETFENMVEMAAEALVRPHIKRIYRAKPTWSIFFKNGSRIRFAARERGFGRGKAGVDVIMFDEGQILSQAAVENMTAATNISPIGIKIFVGTPPRPFDRSQVFRRKRQNALHPVVGVPFRGSYIELAAPADSDWRDDAATRIANPAYALGRVPQDAIDSLRSDLGEESYRREGMGIWDSDLVDSAIDLEAWESGTVPSLDKNGELVPGSDDIPGDVLGYSVDVSFDRLVVIGVATKHPDGRVHVELAQADYAFQVDGVVEWLRTRARRRPIAMLSGNSNNAPLAEGLRRAGMNVVDVNPNGWAAASAAFQAAVRDRRVTHLRGQDMLDAAVATSTARQYGTQGGWAFNLSKTPVPVGPLVVAALAFQQSGTRPRRGGVW